MSGCRHDSEVDRPFDRRIRYRTRSGDRYLGVVRAMDDKERTVTQVRGRIERRKRNDLGGPRVDVARKTLC